MTEMNRLIETTARRLYNDCAAKANRDTPDLHVRPWEYITMEERLAITDAVSVLLESIMQTVSANRVERDNHIPEKPTFHTHYHKPGYRMPDIQGKPLNVEKYGEKHDD